MSIPAGLAMTGCGQVFMAAVTREWSWAAWLTAIYVVGATANHSLFLAIHELSHNLGFKSASSNKLLSMVANLPIGIPYCITFKPYHMEHHCYQVAPLCRISSEDGNVGDRNDFSKSQFRILVTYLLGCCAG